MIVEGKLRDLLAQIVTHVDYGPFGERQFASGGTVDPFGFTGYEYDPDSGYNYAINRYQSWRSGRFLSPDLIPGTVDDPQSWNRYAYVSNRPLSYVDPLGLDGEDPYTYSISFFSPSTDSSSSFFSGLWNYVGALVQPFTDFLDTGTPGYGQLPGYGSMRTGNSVVSNATLGFTTRFDRVVNVLMTFDLTGMGGAGRSMTNRDYPGVAVALGGAMLLPGDAGSYSSLKARSLVGDGLSIHHMPQAALGFTPFGKGGAMALPETEHAVTRTFGGRGVVTASQDAGKSFRSVLASDFKNVRSLFGSRYNAGMMDLLKYYRSRFSELMSKY